jgi:DNA-binding MarR family transcriptional regulator
MQWQGMDATEQAYEIIRALRRIVQGIYIHSKQLYREAGLTMPQLLCLKAIQEADHDEVTAAEVSRTVQLRPATVTGILDRLERDGLVLRERRSRDRRKICLSLTAEATRRLGRLPLTLQDRFLGRLLQLEGEERQQLLEALQRVVGMIDASNIDASPILVSGDVKDGTSS